MTTHRWGTRALAALAGIAAGGLTLGVGELVAALVAEPAAAPFLAVGNTFVDLTPEWLKSFAIRTFGENDKQVLLAGMAGVLLLVSAAGGLLELWRRWAGAAVLLVLGAVAVAAALNRPTATAAWAVPTLAGVVAGVVALTVLVGRLRAVSGAPGTRVTAGRGDDPTGTDTDADPEGAGVGRAGVGRAEAKRPSRREVVVLTAAVAGLAVLSAVGGRRFGQTLADVRAARDALRLPPPSDPAPAVPAGAELDVAGVSPFTTPNPDFYRVDTALDLPRVTPEEWRLRIHGMVEREIELDFDDVLGLDLVERMITLTCVSNEVGGELAGNAVWLGYPLAGLLARANPSADADMLLSTSVDGFTAGTPLDVVTDGRDALLAIGMNGEPLPVAHGFPARLVVPGLYGYVSATKWVTDLELTRFDRATAYWTDRGWAAEAPIKTASRIDVPGSFAELPAGRTVVAGVAWAQHRGVAGVEVQVDDGDWRPARLAAEASADTWRQWSWDWDAEPGNHTLRVRATDGAGDRQTDEQAPPFPDGSSGWHSVVVRVT
ncbi:molybdopterin-dependent oxidoreductase [Jiangella sp. DSM 45060]|uniref:molybdopterin-dependent oxidoreductase n=1 Tax=Jiangella sp. DSM 45060 TaxID=1798224 RepID=UPI00087A9595|nr:molybdopterin-dependent oxidoreductase [Jiangella sp. DSM 45060]SDT64704.1 DMSO/TMAO reductase YedYZ, molybdopterin-dependent catalytic subunit [Jiangella sp. DSM 45060]